MPHAIVSAVRISAVAATVVAARPHRRAAIRRGAGAAVSLMLSLLLVVALGSPSAHGEPLNSEPGADNEVTLPWPALGVADSMTLLGANTAQEFSLPVAAGLTPVRLRGLIHAPVDFGPGFVEITDGAGRFLATVDLPEVTPQQAVVPFDVDIAATQVAESTVRLSFTVRQPGIDAEQRCGLGESVEISDLSMLFAGTEAAPTTIAEFFPPVLQRLTIYTPIEADDSEAQAVLTLASAVARTYGTQNPAITVVKQTRGATPPPAPQFTRAVVVESGDAGIALVNSNQPDVFLRVTGRGGQLSDQASLMVNQLQSLAQGPTVRVEQPGSDAGPQTDEFTFEELNLSGEASVLRTADLTVGVDRAALGADRVDGMTVNLKAAHTPVADLDTATVMVSVNGQAVYSAPLGSSGELDATFDVPGVVLRQRIGMEFALTYSPRQLCNPMIAPLTFQLDPQSTVTVRRGGPTPGGFDAVPSALSPEFLVAMDGTSPDQLDYAAQVVADIARLTSTPLTPRVVAVNDAADAETGALIVANASTLQQTSLRPPVGGESAAVQVDLPEALRADIPNGLGSIQVFADESRDRTVVLVSTSGAWSLLDPLFGYIDAQPDNWSSLQGNVVAAGEGGTVTNLAVGVEDAEPPVAQDAQAWPVWVAIAGVVVLGLLLVAITLLTRHRKRQLGASSDPSVSKTS